MGIHLAELIILFVGLIIIGGSVFWIWMIVDCITNKRLQDSQRLIWMLVIIFTHLVGALIYFFAGRSPQPQMYQPFYGQPYSPYQPGQQPPYPQPGQPLYPQPGQQPFYPQPGQQPYPQAGQQPPYPQPGQPPTNYP